jgi:hypothetical protein
MVGNGCIVKQPLNSIQLRTENKRKEHEMEIEKIVNDTRALSKRVHELEGPWDPCALVAGLCVNVGSLAETVMIMEKKRHPREGTSVHIAQNIAGTLYALIELSATYEIDLERAWNETLQAGSLKLAKLESKEASRKSD